MSDSAQLPWVTVGPRRIGPGEPVYVVAEMSANHNGDFDQAVRIIHAAKEAGADAIKLQTYTPDTMTVRSDQPWFHIEGGTPWDGKTLYELYGLASTPWEWHPKLQRLATELGLDFFSTPFDRTAVDFLDGLGVPVFKVASFELVDLPLIEYLASKGKPIILSTGMATIGEIQEAIQAARRAGATQLALLKCTSAYPAPPEEMNLRAIPALAETFGVPIGLSDHTLGTAIPVAAVALGACVVEKHLTLSRETPSPDAAFSLEPQEFTEMVQAIRQVERALGQGSYQLGVQETKSRVFRRSLFAVAEIKAGEVLTAENVRSIRPGYGLPPKCLRDVLGKRATADIQRGTPLMWELVER